MRAAKGRVGLECSALPALGFGRDSCLECRAGVRCGILLLGFGWSRTGQCWSLPGSSAFIAGWSPRSRAAACIKRAAACIKRARVASPGPASSNIERSSDSGWQESRPSGGRSLRPGVGRTGRDVGPAVRPGIRACAARVDERVHTMRGRRPGHPAGVRFRPSGGSVPWSISASCANGAGPPTPPPLSHALRATGRSLRALPTRSHR